MVYAFLADRRDEKQLRELDMALAPTPDDAQEIVDKANMEEMKKLQTQMGGLAPPRRPR